MDKRAANRLQIFYPAVVCYGFAGALVGIDCNLPASLLKYAFGFAMTLAWISRMVLQWENFKRTDGCQQ